LPLAATVGDISFMIELLEGWLDADVEGMS